MRRKGGKKKKKNGADREAIKPIPIPKTPAEIKDEEEEEAFFVRTKDFRQQLHVKEMIKERKS